MSTRTAIRPRLPGAGMTLIEVVIALAILSISMLVLVEATARCLAVIRMARNYQTARAILGRGEADFPLHATNRADDCAVPETEYEPGFFFSRELEEIEDEPKLFRVVTRVSWSEEGHASREEVVSYAYLVNED